MFITYRTFVCITASQQKKDLILKTEALQSHKAIYAFLLLLMHTIGRIGDPAMELLNKLFENTVAGGAVERGAVMAGALRELIVG